MEITMTALEQILLIAHKLPKNVIQDIDKRVGDHLAMGGGHDDHYIHQQLRYAINIIAIIERPNGTLGRVQSAATNNL